MSKKLLIQSTIAMNGMGEEVTAILHEAMYQAKNHRNKGTREAFHRFLGHAINLIDPEIQNTKKAIFENMEKYPELEELLGPCCCECEGDHNDEGLH